MGTRASYLGQLIGIHQSEDHTLIGGIPKHFGVLCLQLVCEVLIRRRSLLTNLCRTTGHLPGKQPRAQRCTPSWEATQEAMPSARQRPCTRAHLAMESSKHRVTSTPPRKGSSEALMEVTSEDPCGGGGGGGGGRQSGANNTDSTH